MSASRMIAILTVVALPLVFAGYMTGRAAPAADPDQKMKASFEALQKKLPGLVEEWAKEWNGFGELKQVKTKIKLARFTGSSDAKITLFITIKLGIFIDRTEDSDQYISLYLRYYNGKWTTIRTDCSQKTAEIVAPLLLAIDLASDK